MSAQDVLLTANIQIIFKKSGNIYVFMDIYRATVFE